MIKTPNHYLPTETGRWDNILFEDRLIQQILEMNTIHWRRKRGGEGGGQGGHMIGGGGQWYVCAPPPPHTHTFNPTFLFST